MTPEEQFRQDQQATLVAAEVASEAAKVAREVATQATSVATRVADSVLVFGNDIGYIKNDIKEIKDNLNNKFVTNEAFKPVQEQACDAQKKIDRFQWWLVVSFAAIVVTLAIALIKT